MPKSINVTVYVPAGTSDQDEQLTQSRAEEVAVLALWQARSLSTQHAAAQRGPSGTTLRICSPSAASPFATACSLRRQWRTPAVSWTINSGASRLPMPETISFFQHRGTIRSKSWCARAGRRPNRRPIVTMRV